MNKMKILSGILCIALIMPISQLMNANATRDRTLDQMITDTFVLINEDGSTRIVKQETVGSREKEISVEDKYAVVNNIGGEIEVVETFDSEEEAIEAATLMEEDVEVQPFDLRTVQYGVVYVNTSGVTEYKMVETGQTGYTSGAFGRDGAFIGEVDGKIRAKYAGVIADFDPSDVDVVAYGEKPNSYYMEVDGYLTHYFVYSSDNIYSSCRVGTDLPYLEAGKAYYSYDGHYFYDTYDKMVVDYQDGIYDQAINANQPYYNYYQYLSHRSLSSLTGDDYNQITQNKLSETSYKTSKFYELGQEFVTQQNNYYVNSLLMFGVAANESDWGRSYIASEKNNLFGHGANDSNPFWDANGYESVAKSIEYHAFYFISRGYLDYNDWRHFGPHTGDKESGLNVKYASDPYWGEKAASRAYYIGEMPTDYQKESIGVIQKAFAQCNLYKEPTTDSTVVTKLTNLSNFPVLILDEVNVNGTLWYKIASDTSLTEDRTKPNYELVYQPNHDYLYIEASKVTVVNEGELLAKDKYTDGNITIPVLENGHQIILQDGNLMAESKVSVADIQTINPNAIITNGDTTLTDPTALVGTGTTITINEKTYTIIKYGDVNGDGKLSPSDYVKVKNHIMKVSTLVDSYLIGADMNMDGKISPADYVKVKNAIMGN